MPFTPDELTKLRMHAAALAEHKTVLEGQRGHGALLHEQFITIAAAIDRAHADVPGVLDSFDRAAFVSDRVQGDILYNARALVSYLAAAAATLKVLAEDAARRPPLVAAKSRGFVTHYGGLEEERALARYFARALERGSPGIAYFVASKPGDIPSGQDWYNAIKRELDAADRFLVLLTPASIERPWVWFESGAAVRSGGRLVGLCAGGLKKSDVDYPIKGLQLLSLEEDGRHAIIETFKVLGSKLPTKPKEFLKRANELAGSATETARRNLRWSSVLLPDGVTSLAWGGPLDHLEDRPPVGERPEFATSLRTAGLQPLWQDEYHVRADARPVFLTDLKKWKRAVIVHGQLLAVRKANGPQAAEAIDAPRGWKGVRVADAFYAWDGPLDDLEDREAKEIPVQLPENLKTALDGANAPAAWRRRGNTFEPGMRQIYLTDRRRWRRAVVSGDCVLVVTPRT